MTTVSVVLEALTARIDWHSTDLARSLQPTLAALAVQTYDDFETVIVLPPGSDVEELTGLGPRTRAITSPTMSYLAAKNTGAREARGDIIAFIDSDAVPAPDWLAELLSHFDPEVGAVAGRTTYDSDTLRARAMSLVSFGVTNEEAGSGFVINNVAFRRDVILAHPLDERIPRHGGCYSLHQRLVSAGVAVKQAPGAQVRHSLDTPGLRFLAKQFARGADAVTVHRLDDEGLLRGTRWRRAHPVLAPMAIGVRRTLQDYRRLARRLDGDGLTRAELAPAAALVTLGRLAGVAGELTATLRHGRRKS